MTDCYHCGLPADSQITALINEAEQVFCCEACRIVALTISDGGLGSYYKFRDQLATKPAELNKDFAGYDLPEVQADFVHETEEGLAVAKLSVQGISCAACAWLIEHHLGQIDGVAQVRVNATTRRCILQWQKTRKPLSELLAELQRIGYQPQPDRQETTQRIRKKENHLALMRLGVAGIGMMQVGMVAVALYAGDLQGIETNWQVFLRWVSLVIATPVVFFSAAPFFNSAARALKLRHLNMDVPVSLAIGLAYSASVWATVTHAGDVYFDSVSMFTFFLLLGRYLEMRARHSSAFASENLRNLLPLTATRIEASGEHVSIPLAGVNIEDTLWVNAGDVIPVDGKLLSAQAFIDESLLTGESLPQKKSCGEGLAAGTLNCETAVQMRVTQTGNKTQLAAIESLVEQAALQKPRQLAFADFVASRFVAAVLVLALLVGGGWWFIDASKAFWVVLSVLVVTCPCALSLATPAALTAGLNQARRLGVLISGPQVMETLGAIQHVVFDKTGTLTEGRMQLVDALVVPSQAKASSQHSTQYYLEVIAALEQHSSHPIAGAFKNAIYSAHQANSIAVFEGQGIAGSYHGEFYRFGRAQFAATGAQIPDEDPTALWQLLAIQRGENFVPVCWVKLADRLRDSAAPAVQAIQRSDRSVTLLSGDRQAVVKLIAEQLGISHVESEALPADKLAWLKSRHSAGERVLMVGDGINDVPILSAADVSVAMGSATRLAQSRADCVLLNGNLMAIPQAMLLSARVQRTIRQNLTWALVYNLIALPVAAAGILPPWLAALGMSFSSLIVVLNAMRISRAETAQP